MLAVNFWPQRQITHVCERTMFCQASAFADMVVVAWLAAWVAVEAVSVIAPKGSCAVAAVST